MKIVFHIQNCVLLITPFSVEKILFLNIQVYINIHRNFTTNITTHYKTSLQN